MLTCSNKFAVSVSRGCQFEDPEENVEEVGAYSDSQGKPHN